MKSRERLTVAVGGGLLAACLLAACGGGGGDADCASIGRFDGIEYSGLAKAVKVDAKLGEITIAACDDGNGYAPEYSRPAWSIPGVDPKEAIAVGDHDEATIFLAPKSATRSPELDALIESDTEYTEIARYRSGGSEASDGGLYTGTIEVADGCLYVLSSEPEGGSSTERVIPAFPSGGVTWDGVHLKSGGASYGVGDSVALVGGFSDRDLADIPSGCTPDVEVWFVGGTDLGP